MKGMSIILAGGSGGLGSAVARRVAAAGGVPVIGARSDRQRAETLAVELAASCRRAVPVVCGDLIEESTRRGLIERAQDCGKLYGLVLLAGSPCRIPVETASADDLLQSCRDNFVAPVLMARDFAAAVSGDASIVFLATMQATAVFPGSLPYAAPKAALVHAARVLARQWGGERRIRVNVVSPGVTDSGMAEASVRSGKYDGFVEEGTILRFGSPDDIAAPVLQFLQPDNYITGQVLTVDGGLTLRM